MHGNCLFYGKRKREFRTYKSKYHEIMTLNNVHAYPNMSFAYITKNRKLGISLVSLSFA